jgi:hypothetical protein
MISMYFKKNRIWTGGITQVVQFLCKAQVSIPSQKKETEDNTILMTLNDDMRENSHVYLSSAKTYLIFPKFNLEVL